MLKRFARHLSRDNKQNIQHKADWLLRCSVTSDNGWFKTAALKRAAPPSADTQTGFFACTFYLVFKEPLQLPTPDRREVRR